MQQTRVRSLVQEEPTSCGATKPVHHNCWACAPEPGAAATEAHGPRAHAQQEERPPQWQACTPQLERSPRSLQADKACAAMKTQHSQWINKIYFKSFKATKWEDRKQWRQMAFSKPSMAARGGKEGKIHNRKQVNSRRPNGVREAYTARTQRDFNFKNQTPMRLIM